MAFINFLQTLDLFGTPLYLFYNKHKKRYSNIGVFFTIGIIGFLIYEFWQSDFIKKERPIVVDQTMDTFHASALYFDKNRLLTFAVSNSNNQRFIEPSIFSVIFYKIHVKSNVLGFGEILSKEVTSLSTCSEDDMDYDKGLYQELGLNNSYCLTNKSFKLEGSFAEGDVSYVAATLHICDNLTSNNTCKSQSEIDAFFKSDEYYFAVNYQSIMIDFYDYVDPIKGKMLMEYQFIDPQIKKRFNIYFKEYEMSTDDGTIFPNINILNNFGHDVSNFDFQSRTSNNDDYFQIILYSNNKLEKISRRYEKLPDSLAQMTGIANFIMILCLMITSQKINLDTMTRILNKLYVFENKNNYIDKNQNKISAKFQKELTPVLVKDKKNIKQTIFMKKLEESKESKPNSSLSMDNSQIKTEKGDKIKKKLTVLASHKERIFNFFKKTTKKDDDGRINLTFWQYVRHKLVQIFGYRDRVVNQLETIFFKELDIIRLLTRLHEVEKLKLILFDEDQLILFNSLSRPMVNLHNNHSLQSKNFNMKMSNLIEGYKKKKDGVSKAKALKNIINRCSANDLINKRLLNLMDLK